MNLTIAIKKLLKLSWPIIVGQLSLMLIGVGDVYVASLYSTKSVAAIGVAFSTGNPAMLFGIGLTMGIAPILAKRRGLGKTGQNYLLSYLNYSLFLGLVFILVTYVVIYFIPQFGLQEEIVPSVVNYLRVTVWSLPFVFGFSALKEYLSGYEDVFWPNFIAFLGIFINITLNYILVFGVFGNAGIGEIGLAWSSLFIRLFMFVALLFMVWKKEGWGIYDKGLLKETWKLSLPVGFMFFLEILAFCLVGIFAGKLTVVEAATNQLSITLASIVFMVPLSLSAAVAVKIGHAFGSKNLEELKLYSWAVISISAVYATGTMTLFFAIPNLLLGMLTNDKEVIEIGIGLLAIAGIFQLVDGAQTILGGVLRGLNRTRIPSITVFFGYWVIGIPLGVYLTFHQKIGVQGLWVGLAVALAFVAFSLAIYLIYTIKKIQQQWAL
jgi:MATE family multidrug resistance protein